MPAIATAVSQDVRAGVANKPPPSPSPSPAAGIRLYTPDGARKYVTGGERAAFLREAEHADRLVRTLCMTLAYAGCRLSEALAFTADRVDLAASLVVAESLKKRRTGVYRPVPVPPTLLGVLDLVHGIRERQSRRGRGRGEHLWPWSRMTGWRAVHALMDAAGLDGPQASPKGLRHGFGVAAVCPPASRSTWCRNGSATPSSPPPPSMPMPQAPRKRTSLAGCGNRPDLLENDAAQPGRRPGEAGWAVSCYY
jgi:integrase/recombinase XerD